MALACLLEEDHREVLKLLYDFEGNYDIGLLEKEHKVAVAWHRKTRDAVSNLRLVDAVHMVSEGVKKRRSGSMLLSGPAQEVGAPISRAALKARCSASKGSGQASL